MSSSTGITSRTAYGSRLMPVVVDEISKQQPDLVFGTVPLTTNISDGFRDVTFSDIASATNFLATWIDKTLGRSSSFETIAYMGLGDLRYVVVFLAAVKCGYKVLLPSLRNSAWMNASLIEQTNCSHLLYAAEVEAMATPLLESQPTLQIHPVKPLDDLIRPKTTHYPYEKSYEDAKWDPVLILHSSGSTGAPRPIQMSHATFAVADNDRYLPVIPGRVNQNWSLWDFPRKEYFFSPFPAFHLAGFSSMVVLPIWYTNATIVLSPPSRPPTGQMVSEIMDQFRIKSIFCPPIIAEQLVQEPGGLEKCASLNFILYAGGPLSQSAGDALSRVTDVCQFYGSTEVGAIQALVPRREDWASLEWHPKYEAIMEPAMDGSFELILYRNPALEKVRVLSCNFPDEEAWRTKDLFRPHTTKPGLWRFHGRADDIIVLSNGEKFNPVPSETQISSHPLLDGALIIGNGHPQASLILEPKDDPSDPDALIEEIWETVEKANAEAPGHGRITRKMILVGSKDTAFDRSPKGTVVRKSTGEKYDQLVAKLYEAGISNNSQHISLASVDDAASIKRFVKAVVASAFHGGSPGDEDDFFELGLDSLQTTEIISLLKGGIASGGRGHDASWITAKFIYDHPSITSLTEGLRSRFTKADDDSSANISVAEQRQSNMESMVRKYTKFLPNLKTPQVEAQSGYHVLLTGSTGSLGTQLLVALASNPSISHITCLDRSADAHQRIKQSLSTWSPAPVLDPSRISFHPVDYSKPDFALSPSTLAYLSATATLIIHNAWKVDFNHSLASFQSVHLRGVQNLINFSIASTLRPRIIFVSSISSIGNWTAIHNHHTTPVVIPETNAETPAVAQPIGYAESKAVAEQVFSVAATSQGVQSTILRVGQIAGPIGEVNGGKWNEHEWFPLLLKTSKALEKIPDSTALGDVDWLPVDVLASAIVDIAFSQIKDVLQVYHLVNPSTRPWADMLPVVRAHLGNPTEVSMREWVTELERLDVHDAEVVAKYPAVKILDFFRDMERYFGASGTRYSTAHAQKCSPRLGNLGPVRAEWVRQWMEHWGF